MNLNVLTTKVFQGQKFTINNMSYYFLLSNNDMMLLYNIKKEKTEQIKMSTFNKELLWNIKTKFHSNYILNNNKYDLLKKKYTIVTAKKEIKNLIKKGETTINKDLALFIYYHYMYEYKPKHSIYYYEINKLEQNGFGYKFYNNVPLEKMSKNEKDGILKKHSLYKKKQKALENKYNFMLSDTNISIVACNNNSNYFDVNGGTSASITLSNINRKITQLKINEIRIREYLKKK